MSKVIEESVAINTSNTKEKITSPEGKVSGNKVINVDDVEILITPDIASNNMEFINIKEEYVITDGTDHDEDDDSVQIIEAKEIDTDKFELNFGGWPVAVNFETVGEDETAVNNESEENSNDDDDDDEEKLRETTDDGMDNESSFASSSMENENSSDIGVTVTAAFNNRKRRKVLKMRNPKRSSIPKFKCNECFLRFSTQIELSVHMYTLHKLDNHIYLTHNQLMCRLCKQIFANKAYLEAHINNVHTEKRTINCVKCQKVFKYRSYCITNSNNLLQNKQRKFTCLHCNWNRKT